MSTSGSLRMTPCPTLSIPRRPALPISWVSWPEVSEGNPRPSNLVKAEITTDRAGMWMPSASVSVAKTTFTNPAWNSSSTSSLRKGSSPAWWTEIPWTSISWLRRPRYRLASSASTTSAILPATNSSILAFSAVLGESRPVPAAPRLGLPAAPRAEDEIDRGELLLPGRALDHPGQVFGFDLGPARLDPAPAAPPVAVEAVVGGDLLLGFVP